MYGPLWLGGRLVASSLGHSALEPLGRAIRMALVRYNAPRSGRGWACEVEFCNHCRENL
jgi:hypothetical protein